MTGNQAMSQPVFSVRIPVWNEEPILAENIHHLRKYLKGSGDHEIIIVSNGSTDGSGKIGQAQADDNPQIRFFELPNKDVAGAFRLMLRNARSDFLISLDIDLSADLRFIDQALARISSCDLVIGSKKLGDQKRSWISKLGSDLYIRCSKQVA